MNELKILYKIFLSSNEKEYDELLSYDLKSILIKEKGLLLYLSSNKMGLIKYLNNKNINDIELFELIKLANSSKYYELSHNNYYYQNSNRILMNEPIKLREKYSFEEIMLNNYLNWIDLLNNNIIENDIYLLYTINILINKYNINNDKFINLSKNIITNSINNCSKSDDYYKYGIKTLKKINKSFK